MTFLCGLAGLFALIDLFDKPRDRSLPWWGDAAILFVAAVVCLLYRHFAPDDDEGDL